MTFEQFHNGLRVLVNIDADEFWAAITLKTPRSFYAKYEWTRFRDNPHQWFIRASDDEARAIYAIVEERTKK